jgi:hypothetical protein
VTTVPGDGIRWVGRSRGGGAAGGGGEGSVQSWVSISDQCTCWVPRRDCGFSLGFFEISRELNLEEHRDFCVLPCGSVCAGIASDVAVARAGACALSLQSARSQNLADFVALCGALFLCIHFRELEGGSCLAGGREREESKELAKLAPIGEYN